MAGKPRALVLWWRSQNLRVRCPYCLREHGHGPGLQPNEPQFRQSDCHSLTGGVYRLLYPYEDHPETRGYGCEFDRTDGTFYTVNREGRLVEKDYSWPSERRSITEPAPPSSSPSSENSATSEEEDELLGRAAGLSLEDAGRHAQPPRPDSEAIMAKLMASPEHRQQMYFSHCVLRELAGLKSLFARYGNGFANATSQEGDNGITTAAAEEDALPTIKWLQSQGVRLDHFNNYGRTGLMEAALWGRLETVKYLIEQGADREARDGNGMRALDLASALVRNDEERSKRAGEIYREKPDASQRRKVIVNLLNGYREVGRPGAEPIPAPTGNMGFFQKTDDGNLALFKSVTVLEVPYRGENKAFASLDRGPEYPVINSMSGYSHPGWPNVLNNDEWTDRSEQLCKWLGHRTPRGLASHVEKQLAAYFVDRHCLVDFEDFEDSGIDPEEREGLQEVSPSGPPSQAVIAISKAHLCSDCAAFFKLLNRVLLSAYGFELSTHAVSDVIH